MHGGRGSTTNLIKGCVYVCVCVPKLHTHACRMTPYVIYMKRRPDSMRCYSWQENTVRDFVPSERHSRFRIKKNPINFTSMDTPVVRVLCCTTWGNWTRGGGDLVFFLFFQSYIGADPSITVQAWTIMREAITPAGFAWVIHSLADYQLP